NDFAVDTLNRTVQSISVSDTLLTDADGGSTFTVTVIFSEAMDRSVAPTIAFSPDVASTLTPAGGSWSADGLTYTATYTVADADVTVSGVDITVRAAHDAHGNAQAADGVKTSAFAIDTQNPAVKTISVSD